MPACLYTIHHLISLYLDGWKISPNASNVSRWQHSRGPWELCYKESQCTPVLGRHLKLEAELPPGYLAYTILRVGESEKESRDLNIHRAAGLYALCMNKRKHT